MAFLFENNDTTSRIAEESKHPHGERFPSVLKLSVQFLQLYWYKTCLVVSYGAGGGISTITLL